MSAKTPADRRIAVLGDVPPPDMDLVGDIDAWLQEMRDGGMLVEEAGEALRERRHAASNGVLIVSFAMDRRGKIVSDIDVRGIGLPGDEDSPLGDALDDLAERAEQAVLKLKGEALEDETVIEQAVARALKKASQNIWDRRPIVETIVLRL